MSFSFSKELNTCKAQYVWIGKKPIKLSILSIAPLVNDGPCFSSWKEFKTALPKLKPPLIVIGFADGFEDLRSLCLPISGLAICLVGEKEELSNVHDFSADILISLPVDQQVMKTFKILRKRIEYEAYSIEQAKANKKALQGLAHDLRTPTTTIMAYVELLKEDVQKACLEDLNHISQNAFIMEDLASRIIALTKDGATAIPLHPKKTSVESLLSSSLESINGIAKAKKIQINYNNPDSLPDLWIDPVAGQRILSNLLDNAVSTSPEGGKITIETIPTGEFIRFRILDEGCGLSPEFLNRIFMRPKNTKKTHGLGLAITWELVTLHDGVIWAENRSGKGAAFTFTLPTVQHQFFLFKSSLAEVSASPVTNGINLLFRGNIGKEAVGSIRNNVLATTEDAQFIYVDLSECVELSSGILALIVELSLESEKKSCRLKIKNVPPALQPLLKEINLTELNEESSQIEVRT